MTAGFYFVMVLAKPDAIGLGDAKLALLTGLALGWFGMRAALLGLLAATLLSAIGGMAMLVTCRIHLRQAFAHGPAMLAGALITFALLTPPVG